MMSRRSRADRTVVIIGAGPAGCALAIRLAERGLSVAMFDSGRRPSLLVGESLVPAAMPHLDTLGVTDAVRSTGVYKPGALLVHGSGERADFRFRAFGRRAPAFACNVARPAFDKVLAERAKAVGVHIVARRAGVIARSGAANGKSELALDEASLGALGLVAAPDGSRQPALLIDATGRARVFARKLGLSATRGPRDDIARFAHFEGMRHDDAEPGQIVISVLDKGWSWRIPLGDRVSVGVVLPRDGGRDGQGDSTEAGARETTAEHLERAMREEPLLAGVSSDAQRVSRALRYEQYQLVGERASGPGWAAVGDAFGFVDPMLSPGVFLSLEGAMTLAKHIDVSRDGRPVVRNAAGYERLMRSWFDGWNGVIETFYDGRMLAMQRAARQRQGAWLHVIAESQVRRAISKLVSGAGTRSKLARRMLDGSARQLLRDAGPGEDAASFAVRREI